MRIERRMLSAFKLRSFARMWAQQASGRINPVALLAAVGFNVCILTVVALVPFDRQGRSATPIEEVSYPVSLKPVEIRLPEEPPPPPLDEPAAIASIPRPPVVASDRTEQFSRLSPPVFEPPPALVPWAQNSPVRIPGVIMTQIGLGEGGAREPAGPQAALPVAAEGLAAVQAMVADYWDHVRSRIASCLRYPVVARQRQAEGTVVVEIALDAEGRLFEVRPVAEPEESSLTRAVLAAVRKAAPFGPPPAVAVESATNLTSRLAVRFDLLDAMREEQDQEKPREEAERVVIH